MTDKEKLDRLLAEIDRLLAMSDLGYEDGDVEHGYKRCLYDLKRLYNSMQDDPASVDLETEIEKYIDKHLVGNSSHRKDYEMWGGGIARHFAAWQKSKDAKLIINAKEDGYRLGLATMKQQMMKEAITGQLENGEDYLRIKCLYTSCRPQDDGKLVKFIIIKED